MRRGMCKYVYLVRAAPTRPPLDSVPWYVIVAVIVRVRHTLRQKIADWCVTAARGGSPREPGKARCSGGPVTRLGREPQQRCDHHDVPRRPTSHDSEVCPAGDLENHRRHHLEARTSRSPERRPAGRKYGRRPDIGPSPVMTSEVDPPHPT